ncbi:signal transduction histidine kinase [Dongia mobilis]|uniref:histidine kinase n=1 Tax=Dongia mobilis TaxID=578943 RepID=A0A4V3DEU8_9PROT|nr:ATP-binding protein [Dongia mobilis]TDQ82378.1 signal transduction histidine kinase [Dongia mobilis]
MNLRRFVPDSILAWLLLILVTAVLASQAVTVLLHNINRNEVLLRLEDQRAAERIAALATFLDHTAPILRRGVADAMSGPSLDVRVGPEPLVAQPQPPRDLVPLATALADRLQRVAWREIRVGAGIIEARHAARAVVPVRVAIRLADDSWLNFEFPMVADLPWASPQLIGLTIGSVVAVLGLCLYAVLRLMRPLNRLTRAAESLGRAGVDAGGRLVRQGGERLPEQGVGELRRAASAFNAMQARIARLIEDRLQMIAAISHDLKTPITRLRLRAEFMADNELRQKMLADLDEMETMIGATLAFARAEGNPEPAAAIDLRALLREAAEHQSAATLDIAGDGPWMTICQRLALKRALGNLIDNAIHYGARAAIALSRKGQAFEILIEDDGPGIPEGEMERVFHPFYRLEQSRNRNSGGTGLGLAIARAAILAQGGTIELQNRKDAGEAVRGLRVRVLLPADPGSSAS